jgi:hypothetical protein
MPISHQIQVVRLGSPYLAHQSQAAAGTQVALRLAEARPFHQTAAHQAYRRAVETLQTLHQAAAVLPHQRPVHPVQSANPFQLVLRFLPRTVDL